MKVTEAVQSRHSVRAFLDKPVSRSVLESLLERARCAPSGGNLQPWRVDVLGGEELTRFSEIVMHNLPANPRTAGEYLVYPPKLKEPYRTRRFKCGESLYASLKIPREDKTSRLMQFANNFRFFGAPVAMFFSLDRCMQPGQWSDMGMFIQTLMLLAREEGLHTCAQESWAYVPKTVGEFFNYPDEHMLFCGLAIGYKDESHDINQWRTERAPLDEFVGWHGI